MSSGNIQQTYALLQQMYALMQQIEVQGQKTQKQIDITATSVRQFEQMLMRSLIITQRLCGDDDLRTLISSVQRAILVTYQLNSALKALTAASMANPVGLILAVSGMAISAINIADSISYEARG